MMGNTIMNMLGLGGPTGKEFLRAQTPRNTLLDSMSPEVASMFQQQFGINPLVDPTVASSSMAQANPMTALSALSGLLQESQPQMLPMVQQQAMPGINIQPVDLSTYYGGILT